MKPSNKIILALDTATPILDVAIITSNGDILASFTSDDEKTHSERAMPAVDAVLKQANLTINDIDIFAACIGPGSYTGVRIGVAIAKGLAAAAGKPYMGISSLDLMAHNTTGLAVPIIDARRGAVFAAVYQDGQQISPPERIPLEELKEKISQLSVGEGLAPPANSTISPPTVVANCVRLLRRKTFKIKGKEFRKKFHHNLSFIIHHSSFFILPHPNKWRGITPKNLGNMDIIYLGGSVPS